MIWYLGDIVLLFPLPFLTALFLVIIIIQIARYDNKRAPLITVVTLSLYAIQSILLGLNWSVVKISPLILSNVAMLLPPLTWLSLNEHTGCYRTSGRYIVFIVTALVILVNNLGFWLGQDLVIDGVSILLYAGFGLHLIWLGWHEDFEWMETRPLHAVTPNRRAYFIVGAILLLSSSIDVMIAIDVKLNDSQISSALVGYSNLGLLIILLMMFFRLGDPARRRQAETQESNKADKAPSTLMVDPELTAVLDQVETLMNTTHLYREENLSLKRIANKAKLPSRQISNAVNTLKAMNVPQYVNTFRIEDACRMLAQTDTPVTEIVFAVGFSTKSNFNREFQRVTGISPSQWREQVKQSPSNGTTGHMQHAARAQR